MPRRTQEVHVNCTPPHTTSADVGQIHVTFAPKTTYDICSLQTPPVDYEGMMAMCSDFCAPYGIPVIMGNTQYGFNLEKMNEICVSGVHGVFTHNERDNCRETQDSLTDIQYAVANFTVQLERLAANQLKFLAMLQEEDDRFNAEIKSEFFQNLFARTQDKITAIKTAMQDTRAQIRAEQSWDMTGLRQSISAVRQSAGDLRQTIRDKSDNVRWHIQHCNDLFLALGANNEYLLDICAQNSNACIEQSHAEHVGCCCGRNPMQTFGQPGSDAFAIDASTNGRRRLILEEVFDTIAKVYEAAKPVVETVYDEIRAAGYIPVVTEFLDEMESYYQGSYCAYKIITVEAGHAQFLSSSLLVVAMVVFLM